MRKMKKIITNSILLITFLFLPSFCQLNDTVLFKNCETLLFMTNYEPKKIVEEFIKRNLNGEFTKTDFWLDTVVLCPNSLPGWDVAELMKSEEILNIKITKDSAFVKTSFISLGEVANDSLRRNIRKGNGIIKLVNTKYGWRICSHFGLCLSIPYVLKSVHLNYQDSLWITKQ